MFVVFLGTHLYVLYEGYGFSVASLYCLGFITGAVTAPITGPMVDKLGRKKAALLYCFLEVGINMLEQFPFLSGLIVSRVVGGVTTNLLSTVFEAWVDTEYRKRRFDEDKYENLMRDSVVVSNLAAIASGYLAHVLAERLGPVGPFEGAVTCTAIAFAVVLVLWTENYGSPTKTEDDTSLLGGGKLRETIALIRSDSRVLRVCITQGFTMASLHIFIFLWSPVLKEFAAGAERGTVGLDDDGEPAYGLIFGAFMTAGVVGGLCSPSVRKMITLLLSPMAKSTVPATVTVNGEELRPMDVEFQGAFCYFLCAGLLLVPCLSNTADPFSYKTALIAFVMYELLVGIYSPCEGVIRSLYMPSESRGSMMTIPRFIVNVAVALGVVATEVVS
jgi:MFS family permease